MGLHRGEFQATLDWRLLSSIITDAIRSIQE
jgi:hypothetical protein